MRFLILAMTALALTGCVTHQQRQQAAADRAAAAEAKVDAICKASAAKNPADPNAYQSCRIAIAQSDQEAMQSTAVMGQALGRGLTNMGNAYTAASQRPPTAPVPSATNEVHCTGSGASVVCQQY